MPTDICTFLNLVLSKDKQPSKGRLFKMKDLEELLLRRALLGPSVSTQNQTLTPFLGRGPVTIVITLGELSLMELVHSVQLMSHATKTWLL